MHSSCYFTDSLATLTIDDSNLSTFEGSVVTVCVSPIIVVSATFMVILTDLLSGGVYVQ